MKYKTLLTGKNNSVIDDFFSQSGDDFELMTTSVRYEDIIRHLQYFDIDIFIYCIYNESWDNYNQMVNVRHQLTRLRVPFILIGTRDDCDEFEKIAVNVSDLTLYKPLTAEAISMQVLNFMRGWKAIEQKVNPKPEKEELPKEVAEIVEQPVSDKRKHILVVDDSPIMLKTLKENLRDDYDVATAVSGRIALKFLEKKKTDLILLDYEMPEENGPAVLEKLRANRETKDIPVIFLTGVTDSGKIKEALVLKPKGYLLKPINRDKLMDAIVNAIGE